MEIRILKSYILRFLPGRFGLKYECISRRRNIHKSKLKFDAVVRNLSKNSVVLDLGANRGKYTSILSCKAGKVIAFEPDSLAFEILQGAVKNCSNVHLENAAVSNYSGTSTMYRRDNI